jgi:hypothetical protein
MMVSFTLVLGKVIRVTDFAVVVYTDHERTSLADHRCEQRVAIAFAIGYVTDARAASEQLCARLHTAIPSG